MSFSLSGPSPVAPQMSANGRPRSPCHVHIARTTSTFTSVDLEHPDWTFGHVSRYRPSGRHGKQSTEVQMSHKPRWSKPGFQRDGGSNKKTKPQEIAVDNHHLPVPQELPLAHAEPPAAWLDRWTLRPDHSLIIRTSVREPTGRVVSSYDRSFTWPTLPGSVVDEPKYVASPRCGNGLHGLEWGRGARSYLSRDDNAVYQVLDVAHTDMIRIMTDQISSNEPHKVKFRKGTLIYSGVYEAAVKLIADNTPADPAVEAEIASLSAYRHRLFAFGHHTDLSYENENDDRVETTNPSGADLISSEIKRPVDASPWSDLPAALMGDHTVMLDIDWPCKVIPSATEGHFHLYIDKPMDWDTYTKLIQAFMDAGIVEAGYGAASFKRKASYLRVPSRPKLVGE